MNEEILAFDSALYVIENKMENTKDFFERQELKEKLKKIEFDKFKVITELEKNQQKEAEIKEKEEKKNIHYKGRDEHIKSRIKSYL